MTPRDSLKTRGGLGLLARDIAVGLALAVIVVLIVFMTSGVPARFVYGAF
jgi:hypothetical protein